MLPSKPVVKWTVVASAAASLVLLSLLSEVSPKAQAWENTMPWCLVSDSGTITQCFNTQEMCKKQAEKQHKTCVFIPPKK